MTGKPISIRQVQREIREGRIKGEEIDGRYFVKESSLKHYQRRHRGRVGRNEK
jgi:hypothetical protein